MVRILSYSIRYGHSQLRPAGIQCGGYLHRSVYRIRKIQYPHIIYDIGYRDTLRIGLLDVRVIAWPPHNPNPRQIRLIRMGRVTITTWRLRLTRLTGWTSMGSISIPTRMHRVTSLGSLPGITNMTRLNRLTRLTRMDRHPILNRLCSPIRIPGRLPRIVRLVLAGGIDFLVKLDCLGRLV